MAYCMLCDMNDLITYMFAEHGGILAMNVFIVLFV